ncbi:D-2-hydroxyacid dehydrogenase [Georgenia subflava]|uniref:D-2-hydroxyacid dehydrogenase n=1 Tax=Georgenia subflava TaxID=1622177 RepID=A0A6N7EHB6_9MICO|nr:D-2-hydroxyacid dehydrogenase [Georgenia subflava]
MPDELCEYITRAEPRIDLVVDQDLLPPMRFPGDHDGDPAFTRSPEQQARFEELVDSADVLYGIPDTNPADLTRTVRANPRLRWVHTMAAGGGGQVKAAGLTSAELDRVVFSTSAGAHAATLAEFALFGVLAGAKDLPKLQAHQARKEWAPRWAMRQLSEMTVLVVGLGSIGRATVAKLSALGAKVVGTSRRDVDVPGLSAVVHPDDLAAAAAEADAIVSTLPGTDATHQMISADVLAAVRPGTIFVSVGRGTVVDEQALVSALEDGRIGFAALDVFYTEPLPSDSPLWQLPNVVVAPHTAALNDAEDRLIAELFVENAGRLLDGRPLLNVVDTVEFY